MSLLDEVAKHKNVRASQCLAGQWLATTEYTTEELREAADAHSKTAVWRFAREHGFEHGRTSMENHINGVCGCR